MNFSFQIEIVFNDLKDSLLILYIIFALLKSKILTLPPEAHINKFLLLITLILTLIL